MSADVFISYSTQDKLAADAVCAILESQGIRCWIAPRDIALGADWTESLVNAIEACPLMVLVFSQHANDSRQIKREVNLAVDSGHTVIPVRVEDVMPSKSLKFSININHWLDAFPPPLENHLHQLVASIHGHLNAMGSKADPAPVAPTQVMASAPAPEPMALEEPEPETPRVEAHDEIVPFAEKDESKPPMSESKALHEITAPPAQPETALQTEAAKPNEPPHDEPSLTSKPPFPTANTKDRLPMIVAGTVFCVVTGYFGIKGLSPWFEESSYYYLRERFSDALFIFFAGYFAILLFFSLQRRKFSRPDVTPAATAFRFMVIMLFWCFVFGAIFTLLAMNFVQLFVPYGTVSPYKLANTYSTIAVLSQYPTVALCVFSKLPFTRK
jgi:hypothetical protein